MDTQNLQILQGIWELLLMLNNTQLTSQMLNLLKFMANMATIFTLNVLQKEVKTAHRRLQTRRSATTMQVLKAQSQRLLLRQSHG